MTTTTKIEKNGAHSAKLYVVSLRMGVESAKEMLRMYIQNFKLDPKEDLDMTEEETTSLFPEYPAC